MFVPNKFDEIKEQLCEILVLLQKYCVSFFHGKEDAYLETAYSYEQKRKELSESISDSIERISDTIMTYRKGQLMLKNLGLYANELARKCYCQEAPILFVVPDLCQTIRDTCAGIMRWVELDSGYASFLYHDLVEIKQKKDLHFQKVRDLKEKRCQLNHRIRMVANDIDNINDQLNKMENKEKDVIKLKVTTETIGKKIEMNHQDANTLNKDAANKAPQNTTKTGSQAGSPRAVSVPVVSFGRSISTVSCSTHGDVLDSESKDIARIRIKVGKFKLIDEKNEALGRKKSVLNKLQKLRNRQDTELVLEEHELARLERCYTQLKDIYSFRKCTGITKKIFQNVPILPRCNAEKVATCKKIKVNLPWYMVSICKFLPSSYHCGANFAPSYDKAEIYRNKTHC